MNFHNPAQLYPRPMMRTQFRCQTRRQKVFTWSADKVLFFAIGKVMLILLPLVLVMNLWLASWSSSLIVSLKDVDNTHRILMDKQIKLRAEKAQLYSPEQVQLLAAEKFSLHVPGKEQIVVF